MKAGYLLDGRLAQVVVITLSGIVNLTKYYGVT